MAKKPKRIPKISILLPFTSHDKYRRDTFRWLLDYWEAELPEAEIIVGHSTGTPFNKTEALNNAANKAHGRVLAIMDADALLRGSVVDQCADDILADDNDSLWFIPYRKLYRLNTEVTYAILNSDPTHPLFPPDPPPDDWLDNDPAMTKYGRAYAALAYIIPREALDALGCWDERFDKGWGGEDVSTLRALDLLYGKHKTTDNGIFHLWHPKLGDSFRTRAWSGQTEDEPNKQLALRYHRASNNPSAMRELVDEGCEHRRRKLEQGIAWDGPDDFLLEVFELVKEKNRKFY